MSRWSAAPKAGVGPEWADESTDAASIQDKALLAHLKWYIHKKIEQILFQIKKTWQSLSSQMVQVLLTQERAMLLRPNNTNLPLPLLWWLLPPLPMPLSWCGRGLSVPTPCWLWFLKIALSPSSPAVLSFEAYLLTENTCARRMRSRSCEASQCNTSWDNYVLIAQGHDTNQGPCNRCSNRPTTTHPYHSKKHTNKG